MKANWIWIGLLVACQSPNRRSVDWDFQNPDAGGSTRIYLDSSSLKLDNHALDSAAWPICIESSLAWEGKGNRVPGVSSEFAGRGMYRGPAVYRVVFYSRNSSPHWLIRLGSVSAKEGQIKDYPMSSVSGEAWVRQSWNVPVSKDQHLRMEISLLDPGELCIRGLEIRKLF